MTDDVYQLALSAMRRQLDEAAAPYEVDDGELIVAGHRLGLSIGFEGFVPQAGQVIAPLDIQLHLDGDEGERFRLGTLGVGASQSAALQAAVAEWHLLAAAPVLSALGAVVSLRRQRLPQQLAGWDFFPGRVGVRGQMPPALEPNGPMYRALLEKLRGLVSGWPEPNRFELRSICVLASGTTEGHEVQAAVDGMVHAELAEQLGALSWPHGSEAYLFKQLFVFRSRVSGNESVSTG